MTLPKWHTFYGLFFMLLEKHGIFPGRGLCIFQSDEFFFHCNRSQFFVAYERNRDYVIPPDGFAVQVIVEEKSMLAAILGPTFQQIFGPDMEKCLYALFVKMSKELDSNEDREKAVRLIDHKVDQQENLLLFDETQLRKALGLKPKPMPQRF